MPDLRCQFCPEEQCLDRCDWPARGFVLGRYRELVVGDRVRRFQGGHDDRPAATVAEIEDRGAFYVITLKLNRRQKYDYKVITVQGPSFVRVERFGKCAAICCERHRCDRGPGAVCCMSHWAAWEQEAIA